MGLMEDLTAAQQRMKQAQDALIEYAENHPGENAKKHKDLLEHLNRATKEYMNIIRAMASRMN